MIGEASVGFEIAASRYIGAEGRKQTLGKESACAVAGIDNDPKAGKRLCVLIKTEVTEYFSFKPFDVGSHYINFAACSALTGSNKTAVRRGSKDGGDVLLLKTAARNKEFHAVALHGKVACRHHDACVKMKLIYAAHEHCRRACHTAVICVCADEGYAVRKPRGYLGTGEP